MAKMVRMTLEEAVKVGRIDKAKFDATTDEDIARQIAEDPDTAPDVTTLGDPLPNAKAVRLKCGMNQEAFAGALRVPVSTIRNWEQGRTRPDAVGASLLALVDRDAKTVFRILGTDGVAKGRMRRAAAGTPAPE